jgi:glycosyltransferase involved in cell wall biosynthesis
MAAQGVEIDLLTYGEGSDVDVEGVRIVRTPRFRILGSVRAGPSLLKLWLDVFILVWCVALLLRRRYAFVHAHEESVFFLTLLRPLFGFKLIYDMHSSLPQQLENFAFTRSRALIGLFRWFEDRALRTSDVVITICPSLQEHALARMPDGQKHILIENSLFDEVRLVIGSASHGPPTRALTDWRASLEGCRTVAYAGTFERYQGLDLLIEAFARIRETCPDVRLLLIGGTTSQVEELRALSRRLGVDAETLFTSRLPQEVARSLMRSAAVVVSPRSAGTNTPLKIYEILAGDVPLVATRIPSHTQILDESVCFLAEPTSAGLASALRAALDEPADAAERVSAARELYRRAYSRDAYHAKIRRVLEVVR